MDGANAIAGGELAAFAGFAALWVPMTAAMMLPAAIPAVIRSANAGAGVRAASAFIVSYLCVWMLAGLAAYAAYRPHGPAFAGAIVIAAGVYEATPFKSHFRRRCRDGIRSGFAFGLCCVGSCIGLMLMQVSIGVMSVPWMCAITAVVLAQKLLPPNAAVDVPLALAIAGIGTLIIVAPSLVPGFMPSM